MCGILSHPKSIPFAPESRIIQKTYSSIITALLCVRIDAVITYIYTMLHLHLHNLDINSYDDSNASKQLIKSTVDEKYTFEWLAKLQDLTTNPILRTYSLFKKEFRWENYLSCVQNPQ